ncbi:MAG: hypothetical protein JNM17_17705 [Archangium sp.]|nr:hypothetical protein [Archangium sp.]
MRLLMISLLAFSACTSQEVCNSLPVGSSFEGKKAREITSTSDPVFKSMVDRSNPLSPSGAGYPIVWEKGLALEAMCCATKDWGTPRTWCSEQQLECTDPKLQNVKVYVLEAPFSNESGAPDWGNYCIAAVHENAIIALWHRNWT